jgi:hypothetical protein
MEELKGNVVKSEYMYEVGTEFVARDSKKEHVVKVIAVQRWGWLWKHVIEIVDQKFENLY